MAVDGGTAPGSESPFEMVLSRLSNVKRLSNGNAMATCPCHPDATPSLSITTRADGAVLLNDFGHCETEAIVEKLGLKMADLFPAKQKGRLLSAVTHKLVATYTYRNAAGETVFQVCRYFPKKFSQRRPGGAGGWINNLNGVTPVLYRLPEMLAAGSEDWVIITEGEKDADAVVIKLGMTATTNAGGAGKFSGEFAPYFKDRRVVILPDNDDSGKAHTRLVAQIIAPVAREVTIVSLPGLPPKGDVSDWLEVGGTREELLELIEAAPAFQAAAARLIIVEKSDQHQVIASQAFAALRANNNPIRLVRFGNILSRIECGGEEDRIVTLDADRLRDEFTRAADWCDSKFRPAVPSADFGRLMMVKENPPLPAVTRFARGPVFTHSGRLLMGGYDAESRIFVLRHGFELGNIPTKPSTDELIAAVDLLLELVQDFPFAGDADKANAFALPLERLVRDAIKGALPINLFTATVAGAGKGKLVRVTSYHEHADRRLRLDTGQNGGRIPESSDEFFSRRCRSHCDG